MADWVSRHYLPQNLTFDQFVGIATILRESLSFVRYVEYELKFIEAEYKHNLKVTDPAKIRRKLSSTHPPVRKYEAWLSSHAPGKASSPHQVQSVRLSYRTIVTQRGDQLGLSLSTDDVTKLGVYRLEMKFLPTISLMPPTTALPIMGEPCEILAVVVDMRDFTKFYEDPRVESPYVSGLLTSFYDLMKSCFDSYPPDSVKFLGDGMLALWRTRTEDRGIAGETSLRGLVKLNTLYGPFRKHPDFIHGTPEKLGAGVAYGLASKMIGMNDFIGRPIIIASRLCSVCPGGSILVQPGYPGIEVAPNAEGYKVDLKSLGTLDILRINPATP